MSKGISLLSIKKTDKVSDENNPVVILTVNGNSVQAEQLPDGSYREYDDSYKSITYSYTKETDEEEIEDVRKETGKKLVQISNNRYFGIHKYTSNQDDFKTERTAMIIWQKNVSKNVWLPSYRKGLSDLTPEDINKITETIK